MNEESNGQVCQLCRVRIARPEALCGCIYLCDECARYKGSEAGDGMHVNALRSSVSAANVANDLSKQRQQADDNTIK